MAALLASDELALSRQMGKINDSDKLVSNHPAKLAHLLMRLFEKIVQHAEFMHQLECGRVYRVTSKIAQKVRGLLGNHDVQTGAGQQYPDNHPCGAAAADSAPDVY